MKTVGCITTPGLGSAVCVCNVLAQKRARIITINRPPGFRGHDKTDNDHEIWFEHECAIEESWRESVMDQASKKWKEQQRASVSKSG